METHGYIYFMTNRSNSVLYVGVTESLVRRVSEHAAGQGSVFTAKYNCHKLVYYEVFQDIVQAIAREKKLKHYNREWKNQLVDKFNPSWNDLAIDLTDDPIA